MPEVSAAAPRGAPPKWSPGFSCVRSQQGGTTTVVVCGELDIATAPELERALCDGETGAEVVIVDLRDVGFIDSSGLHVIVAAHERIRRAGRRLLVVPGSAAVRRLFAVSGLDHELELVELPPARA